MSGWLCSPACVDFFERDRVPIEEPSDPGNAAVYAAGFESGSDLGQRDVAMVSADICCHDP